MRTTGRTVLVVGGTSGIGLGFAERLLAAGNEVLVAGRRQLVHPELAWLEVDVSDPASVLRLRDRVLDDHPATDVVVSMAGVMLAEDLLDPSALATAEHTVDVNLLGTIRVVSAFAPHLAGRDEATLITVSSGLAFVPLPMTPTYSATKAAIHSFTESLRVQLAHTSVQVIELVPPGVRTTLFGQEAAGQGMPLTDYLDEVMELLHTRPEATEVCVEEVGHLRTAERRGAYGSELRALSVLSGASGL